MPEQRPDAAADSPPDNGNGDKRKSIPRPVIVAGVIAAAMVLLVAAIWGGAEFGYAYTHETTDDAKIDADTYAVTSKIAERVDGIFTDTNRYVRQGQLLVALDAKDETARLAQAVAQRNIAVAQAQQAEQALLLTRTQVATETQQGRGNLQQARAEVGNAAQTYNANRRESEAARAAVAQARAQSASASAALAGAHENVVATAFDLARDSRLLRTGDVSTSDVDADRSRYESARSNYGQALANIKAARASVANAERREQAQEAQAGASGAEVVARQGTVVAARGRLAESDTGYRITAQEAAVRAAQSQIRSADTQIRMARDQLSYTRIYSPVSGVVAAKSIDIGQAISPGQTLFIVVPQTRFYITANYKETQLDRMRLGQPVDIHVDAYPEIAFIGHLAEFNPASQNQYALVPPQNSSGNFVKVTERVPVRLYVDRGGDRDHPLRPGMSVETSVRVR